MSEEGESSKGANPSVKIVKKDPPSKDPDKYSPVLCPLTGKGGCVRKRKT